MQEEKEAMFHCDSSEAAVDRELLQFSNPSQPGGCMLVVCSARNQTDQLPGDKHTGLLDRECRTRLKGLSVEEVWGSEQLKSVP